MAFLLTNWSRQSVALNTGEVTVNSVPVGGPALFSYRADETMATIVAANYFAPAVYDLSLDDLIYIVANDSVGMYVVSAINRAASTISLTAASLTGSVNTANIVDLAVTTAKLADGAVTNVKVDAAAAIAFSKLEVMTSGNILVGSAANVATEVTMSGDATIIASGALTIANDAVTTAKILNANVTSAKLALNVLQYATVAISAAEFNGMYATPKLLVAAAGANTLIVLDKVDLLMTYVSANYANGGVAAVQYDSTANGAGVIASTTLSAATFQAAASTGFMFNTGVVAQTFTNCVNKGLYLSNITGAFDTGDSTFVAHVYYKVISTI